LLVSLTKTVEVPRLTIPERGMNAIRASEELPNGRNWT